MTYRLGTCCMLDVNFGYSSMTAASWNKNKDLDKLWSIWLANINKTQEAIDHLVSLPEVYHFFRVSSSLFPLATLDDPVLQDFWFEKLPIIQTKLLEIGKKTLAVSPNFRIVTHPGQFCVPNSKNPRVVENSIRELNYHYDFMKAFSIPFSINIHLSGKDSDNPNRMLNVYNNYLSDGLRKTLSLENDEKSSSISDLLNVSCKCDILICYDIHHEAVNRTFKGEPYYFSTLSEEDACFIESTWKNKLDLPPTMHISNRANVDSVRMPACAHSDWFYDTENTKLLWFLERGWDCEMEAKQKLPSIKKFITDYVQKTNF